MASRPGLPALRYRAGRHSTFLESMIAGLSAVYAKRQSDIASAYPDPRSRPGPPNWLHTRETTDPTIAFLDAWATVGDVLTFYQERIANEGYLKTARERRSLHELANQVGYQLRPALSASVYLAFDVQAPPSLSVDVKVPPPHETLISKATQAKSIPEPGQVPALFETADDLIARPEWNDLKPRLTKPTVIDINYARDATTLRFQRTDLGLQPGDLLLLVPIDPTRNSAGTEAVSRRPSPIIRTIAGTVPDFNTQQTIVTLQPSAFSFTSYRNAILTAVDRYLHFSAGSLANQHLNEVAIAAARDAEAIQDIFTAIDHNNPANLIDGEHQAFAEFSKHRLFSFGWTEVAQKHSEAADDVKNFVGEFRNRIGKAFVVLASNKSAETFNGNWRAIYTSFIQCAEALKACNEVVGRLEKDLADDVKVKFKAIKQHSADLLVPASKFGDDDISASAKLKLKGLTDQLLMYVTDANAENEIPNDTKEKIKADVLSHYGAGVDVTAALDEWDKIFVDLPGYRPGDISTLLLQPPWGDSSESLSQGLLRVAAIFVDREIRRDTDNRTAITRAIHNAVAKELKEGQAKLKRRIVGEDISMTLITDSLNEAVREDLREVVNAVKTLQDKNSTVDLLEEGWKVADQDFRIYDNSLLVQRIRTAAEATIDDLYSASAPAAAAIVVILRDSLSQLSNPSEGDAAKFVRAAIASIEGYPNESESVPPPSGSRLTRVRTKLFLPVPVTDALVPVADGQKTREQVRQGLQMASPGAAASDIDVLTTRILEIDAAMRTEARRQEGSPFRLRSGLGSTNSLLSRFSMAVSRSDSKVDLSKIFDAEGDLVSRLLSAMKVDGSKDLLTFLKDSAESVNLGQVFAFKHRSGLFGAGAAQATEVGDKSGVTITRVKDPLKGGDGEVKLSADEATKVVFLEQSFSGISAGGWCLIGLSALDTEKPATPSGLPFGNESLFRPFEVVDSAILQRNAYQISGKTTRIQLDVPWVSDRDKIISHLRSTMVLAGSQQLVLADEVIESSLPDAPFSSGAGQIFEPEDGSDEISLGDYYGDLVTGRVLLITGEQLVQPSRDSKPINSKVPGTHLCRLVSAVTTPDERGRMLTSLKVTPPIPFRFKRDSVHVLGNVVLATHGETQQEILGSGEGQGEFQQFALSQRKLTYLPEATPTGTAPQVSVRVNNVAWARAEKVGDMQPEAGEKMPREYLVTVEDDERAVLTTGDGKSTGERLPTGVANVTVEYRVGGGTGGNVKEGTITQLPSPPLNATKVRNLLPASGGVDRENVDQARRNIPVAAMALDRLLSMRDYESFVRKFAGVAKAEATPLLLGGVQTVVVTVAGLQDVSIERESLLFTNLDKALRRHSDPEQNVVLVVRELMLLILKAKVKIFPDRLWEPVREEIVRRLLREFDFEKARLGGSTLLSDVVAVVQETPGVRYVDIDVFDRMRQFYGPGELVRKAACISDARRPQAEIVAQRARVEDVDRAELILKGSPTNRKRIDELLDDGKIFGGGKHFVAAASLDGKKKDIPESTELHFDAVVTLDIFPRSDVRRLPPGTEPGSSPPFPAQLAYFTDLPGTILLEQIP